MKRLVKIRKKRTLKRKKEIIQPSFTVIKTSIAKIAAILLIIGLNWIGFSAVVGTFAYFNDTETSADNSATAGTLDISLDPLGNYVSGLMYPTDTTATSIILSNNGSLATQYVSKISLLSPDNGACNYASLNATDGTQSYSGPLLNFISATTTIANPVNWNYTFTIDPATPPSVWNKTCYFKWTFTAWSMNVAEPVGGFVDVEEKSGGIRIGRAIALNEILANPVGLDDALKPNGEWVELYNNSNINIDVDGWVVYDSDDSHELYITTANTDTGSTIIPAHGFLVVYRDGDSDFTINNSDETIRLYTGYPVSSSVLVDSYSYTEEKPEGFSYARIPDGVGDWVDPIPTPGRANVLEEEQEPVVDLQSENPSASPSFSETLESTVSAITGFISGGGEAATTPEETPIIEETTTTTPEIIITPEVATTTEATTTPEVTATPETTVEQSPVEQLIIQQEIPPAIEEQPVVIEEPIIIEQPVPPPADPPAPAPADLTSLPPAE